MANGPLKYPGLELPVFDPEAAPLIRKTELRHFRTDDPTFVREIQLGVPPLIIPDLNTQLKITDEELVRLTSMCGAELIKYSWGLYPTNHIEPNKRPRRCLGTQQFVPLDHVLAAEVEFIEGVRVPNWGQYKALAGPVDSYKYSDRKTPRIGDVDESQFVVGTTPRLGRPAILLPDIEPRLE